MVWFSKKYWHLSNLLFDVTFNLDNRTWTSCKGFLHSSYELYVISFQVIHYRKIHLCILYFVSDILYFEC